MSTWTRHHSIPIIANVYSCIRKAIQAAYLLSLECLLVSKVFRISVAAAAGHMSNRMVWMESI